MKRIEVIIEIEEDPLAFEVGMPAHLSLQSDVPAPAVVSALLHAAESIQRQTMIQDNEVEDPTADPAHREVYAGLAARLALVDTVMHLPSRPIEGFVIHTE